MGIKPQTTEQQLVNELENKNAGKTWVKGTEGNEIEPLPGEAVDDSQVEAQFLSDFGDVLGETEDVDVADFGLIENPQEQPAPTNVKQVKTQENEIVLPDGGVINPQNRPVAPVRGQKKRRPLQHPNR